MTDRIHAYLSPFKCQKCGLVFLYQLSDPANLRDDDECCEPLSQPQCPRSKCLSLEVTRLDLRYLLPLAKEALRPDQEESLLVLCDALLELGVIEPLVTKAKLTQEQGDEIRRSYTREWAEKALSLTPCGCVHWFLGKPKWTCDMRRGHEGACSTQERAHVYGGEATMMEASWFRMNARQNASRT